MESFGLLTGHLIGDYIVQNDWMAANKGMPQKVGHLACTVHCLCYTLAVWACSFWWVPWWGLAICFAVHWPIDRWRLAGWWMRNVSGQAGFANGPLAPWSIIIVDNVFHLATLFAIGLVNFANII